MTTWAIRSEQDRSNVIKIIGSRQMPCTVIINKGAPRSIEQNKLQRKWLLEAQEQGDQTAEEYRGYCKLHFGVPILRNENEEFRESYDKIIQPLLYPMKLEMMMVPLDFSVTRKMNTKQKSYVLLVREPENRPIRESAIQRIAIGLMIICTAPRRRAAPSTNMNS